MRPDIIIMLTHHDVTVPNAAEVFEACKDIENVKLWGFKNVGLPKDQMKALTAAMKAAGKTTFLEVVTYDEESCLDGAQTAIDCGFDYLMGTLYYDSVAKLLKDNGMDYLPFVGKVSGSPSILEGTNEEIIQRTAKSWPMSSAPRFRPRSASPAASTALPVSTPCLTSAPGPSRWAPPCSRRNSCPRGASGRISSPWRTIWQKNKPAALSVRRECLC